jgi:hypothetical protein
MESKLHQLVNSNLREFSQMINAQLNDICEKDPKTYKMILGSLDIFGYRVEMDSYGVRIGSYIVMSKQQVDQFIHTMYYKIRKEAIQDTEVRQELLML